MAYGLNAEGGSTHARHGTRASESPLGSWLRVEREAGASRWGYFLRAETMHGLYTYLESNPPQGGREARFHEMSHGESFLEVLRSRFDGSGFYVLDEPESALSFSGCLALVGVLHDLMSMGTAQILLATHSPVSRPCRVRGSSSSTTPAGTRPPGTTWRSWTTTGGSWPGRSATCVTCSSERPRAPRPARTARRAVHSSGRRRGPSWSAHARSG